MKNLVLGLVALASLVIFPHGLVQAQPAPPLPIAAPKKAAPVALTLPEGAKCGIDMVNARRASLGLAPFVKDDALTLAAANAAVVRANSLISGHTANDFAYLPAGAVADAAGCAAWSPATVAQLGWGSCASDDAYEHAGAAYATGRDGLVYMHLFVRGHSATRRTETATVSSTACAGGSCATTTFSTRTRFRRR